MSQDPRARWSWIGVEGTAICVVVNWPLPCVVLRAAISAALMPATAADTSVRDACRARQGAANLLAERPAIWLLVSAPDLKRSSGSKFRSPTGHSPGLQLSSAGLARAESTDLRGRQVGHRRGAEAARPWRWSAWPSRARRGSAVLMPLNCAAVKPWTCVLVSAPTCVVESLFSGVVVSLLGLRRCERAGLRGAEALDFRCAQRADLGAVVARADLRAGRCRDRASSRSGSSSRW